MTVAMMSRITLHLKKQMHNGWDSYGFFGTTTTSEINPAHFGIGRGLSITVQQEISVVHDDHVVQSPVRAKTHRRSEWHELGPVHVAIAPNAVSRPDSDTKS